MPERRIVGITGPPGSGKTTHALGVVRSLGPRAAYLPMDGFHLADDTLRELGTLGRKGAPETFDAWGYAALLRRLRTSEPHPVYAPGFERDLEQPLAGAISIGAGIEQVVTEGNYLLLDRPEWQEVRAQVDEVWFLDVPEDVRRERLLARHVEFGKSLEEAREWITRVDEPNAALVLASREGADRVITPATAQS